MNFKVSLVTSLITFIGICTLLVLYVAIGENVTVIGIEIWVIVLAAIVNLILLIVLVFQLVKVKEQRKRTLKTIGIILINIPAAMLCMLLMNMWDKTIRLTISNEKKTTITAIEIKSTKQRDISELKPGATKTIWIYNPDTCNVSIKYTENGKVFSEEIRHRVEWGGNANYSIGDTLMQMNDGEGCYVKPLLKIIPLTKENLTLK